MLSGSSDMTVWLSDDPETIERIAFQICDEAKQENKCWRVIEDTTHHLLPTDGRQGHNGRENGKK